MNDRHRQSAFTLIEVMVALAIVALSLSIVMTAITEGVSRAESLRERTYAVWIAQNKLAEMRLANVVPEVSTSSGEIDFGQGAWEWRAVVSESGVENLMRVDVSVSVLDSDEVVRTVTGFVGEPVPPGQSNNQWNTLRSGFGVRQ